MKDFFYNFIGISIILLKKKFFIKSHKKDNNKIKAENNKLRNVM